VLGVAPGARAGADVVAGLFGGGHAPRLRTGHTRTPTIRMSRPDLLDPLTDDFERIRWFTLPSEGLAHLWAR
jgi:hypothetical protein